MPEILLVDDDKSFVINCQEGLQATDELFHVHIAENGKIAIKTLESTAIDLVITDLHMPIMDGFSLITYMSCHFTAIPIIVITAFGSTEIQNNIYARAFFQYLEKPFDFNILAERIRIGLRAKMIGGPHGIPLPSVLRLVELEKKSYVLAIRSNRLLGFLYFNNGMLIDAATAHQQGEMAALEIIGWETPEIEIESLQSSRERAITTDLHSLIEDSIRQKEEKHNPDLAVQKDGSAHDLEISYDEPAEEPDILAEPSVPMAEKSTAANVRIPAQTAVNSMGGIAHTENKDDQKLVKENSTDKTQSFKFNKFKRINVPKLHQAIELVRESLAAGLLNVDIYSITDGQIIAGHNSNPAAAALFTQISAFLAKTLKQNHYPQVKRYYMLDLHDNQLVIIIPMGDYQWGMLIDSCKVPLGLILNFTIPQAIAAFENVFDG